MCEQLAQSSSYLTERWPEIKSVTLNPAKFHPNLRNFWIGHPQQKEQQEEEQQQFLIQKLDTANWHYSNNILLHSFKYSTKNYNWKWWRTKWQESNVLLHEFLSFDVAASSGRLLSFHGSATGGTRTPFRSTNDRCIMGPFNRNTVPAPIAKF